MAERLRVFVSHSHHDNDFTRRLVHDLEQIGTDVWVDWLDTHVDFMEGINAALNSCQALVVVVSPYALSSIAVRTEVHAAINLMWQRREMHAVLQVVAEPVDAAMIPPTWAILRRYDAVTNYAHAVGDLCRVLKSADLAALPPPVGSPLPARGSTPAIPPDASDAISWPQGHARVQIQIGAMEDDASVIGIDAPGFLAHHAVDIQIHNMRGRASVAGIRARPTVAGRRQESRTLLMFDVDGVLTEPVSAQPAIDVIGLVAGSLHAGDLVALNTGRGLSWVTQEIVERLADIIWDTAVLDNLCIVSQKGAFLSRVRPGGQVISVADPSAIPITSVLRSAATQLVEASYGDTMSTGEPKEYVFSPQMKPGADHNAFKAAQKGLVAELEALLHRYSLAEHFRVDPTNIATDVEDVHLGKALGARRVLEWLAERGVTCGQCIAFGDSVSDLAMAEEVYRRGLPVEFVFVGDPSLLAKQSVPFPVVLTPARYDRGTFAYLLKRWHR